MLYIQRYLVAQLLPQGHVCIYWGLSPFQLYPFCWTTAASPLNAGIVLDQHSCKASLKMLEWQQLHHRGYRRTGEAAGWCVTGRVLDTGSLKHSIHAASRQPVFRRLLPFPAASSLPAQHAPTVSGYGGSLQGDLTELAFGLPSPSTASGGCCCYSLFKCIHIRSSNGPLNPGWQQAARGDPRGADDLF